jgi:hypothetical protein
VLVVWSDNLDTIIPQCRDFEDHLIKLVWSHRLSLSGITPGPSIAGTGSPAITSATNSALDVALADKPEDMEPMAESEPSARPTPGGSLWGWRIGSKARRAPAPRDLEQGGVSARPTRYFAPVYGGLGLALSTCKCCDIVATRPFNDRISSVFIGSGASILLQEWRLTNDFTRFALLATAPFLFCVSLVSRPLVVRLLMLSD